MEGGGNDGGQREARQGKDEARNEGEGGMCVWRGGVVYIKHMQCLWRLAC